jgi:hypothetical protein
MELRERKKLKTIIEYNRIIKSESIIEITKIVQNNITKLNECMRCSWMDVLKVSGIKSCKTIKKL